MKGSSRDAARIDVRYAASFRVGLACGNAVGLRGVPTFPFRYQADERHLRLLLRSEDTYLFVLLVFRDQRGQGHECFG